MNTQSLSNIIATLAPNSGFAIYGDVLNENDYNSNVVFNVTSDKPSWAEVQAGKEPEQWVIIRAERGGKLSDSDWTVLSDVPMDSGTRGEWETYRQELRDITTQPDPFNITWPSIPS